MVALTIRAEKSKPVKQSKHIVFATTGSLGDLYPFLAVGQKLNEKGHHVVIATTKIYASIVEKAGLTFHHMRPDPEDTASFHAKFMDSHTSAKFVFQNYLSPAIEKSYSDLLVATKNADLLISQSLALAAPLVADTTHIPWLSAVFQPMTLFSRYDPPCLPFLFFLPSKLSFSTRFNGKIMAYAKKYTLPWVKDVTNLKQNLGIQSDQHPIYEGQLSSQGVLAMFSPLIGQPQSDWPEHTVQTGSALFTQHDDTLSDDLMRFIGKDEPFLVFTLGSASSNAAGNFYSESLNAARQIGCRALLLTSGLSALEKFPDPLPEWALRVNYAPYGQIFKHATVIIHSGGIATSMTAIQSGQPQIVVPFAHDQIDNAKRLKKLGISRTIKRKDYNATTIVAHLKNMIADQKLYDKTKLIASQANMEDGATAACLEIEKMLVCHV